MAAFGNNAKVCFRLNIREQNVEREATDYCKDTFRTQPVYFRDYPIFFCCDFNFFAFTVSWVGFAFKNERNMQNIHKEFPLQN